LLPNTRGDVAFLPHAGKTTRAIAPERQSAIACLAEWVLTPGRDVQIANARAGKSSGGNFMKRLSLSLASVLVALGGAGARAETALPDINVTTSTPLAPRRAPVAPVSHRVAPRVAPAVQRPAAPEASPEAPTLENVIDSRPASNIHIDAQQIQRTGSAQAGEILNRVAPSVTLQSSSGNPVSPDIEYRGFLASPTSGTPQGLAVYQNGVRINEAFGDEVNWELIPTLAIASMDLVANNPAFGLNALGGALNVRMKDGFSYQGGKLDLSAGSYGRVQAGVDYGRQIGQYAFYGALEYFHDHSYRDFGESNARRFYGDLGYRNDGHEIHLNIGLANSGLGVPATSPIQMLQQNWAQTYTTPQTTANQMGMANLTGQFVLSPSWTLTGNAYVRRFVQNHVDGNPSNAQACDAGADLICFGDGVTPANGLNGQQIQNAALYNAGVNNTLGEIDRTGVATTSLGSAFQLSTSDSIFGFKNHFSFGASFDYGMTSFAGSAELGVVQPNYVVQGSGIYLGASGDPVTDGPTSVHTINRYLGVNALDAVDVNDRLTITGGARLNLASVSLFDQLGGSASGEHQFTHINPLIGFTYKITPELQAYGSYAESNRAPTPLELACADPLHPCVLASFLTSDPSLKQVTAQTFEAGLRGQRDFGGFGALSWKLGGFSTHTDNDIYNVVDTEMTGFGYFANIGSTLRQGLESQVNYHWKDVTLHASYTYMYATFQSAFQLNSLAPSYAANGGIENVTPGNEMPMIPRHRIKIGADWAITPKAAIGTDVLFVGAQRYVGDEANQNAKLPPYFTLGLHASYKILDTVEVYARGENLLDRRCYLYGTYFDTTQLFQAFSDPRSVTPAQPLSVYAGLRVTFAAPAAAPAAVVATY
jgi:outer membrane receptor protein involved in Fe transport